MITSFDFKDRTILVTGGTKGIGKSIVLALLESKARVVLTYSSDEGAASDFDMFLRKKKNYNYMLLRSDVADRQDVRHLLRESCEKWGQSIFGIVNNAGILTQGDFFTLSNKQWDKTLEVNLKGPFIICQEAIKALGQDGAIVNIASVGGQIGGDRAPDYAASKAGLISLTRSLARIGSQYGVRVNAVAPGWIETPIFSEDQLGELKDKAKEVIPMGRIGNPEEVAKPVLFLLSDAASYITGHCLNVNGGLYFG